MGVKTDGGGAKPMPVDLTYLDDGGILIKARGVLLGSEIADSNREIYGTPEKVKAIAYQLCDFTDVEMLEFTPDDIRSLAAEDSRAAEVNPHMLIAIIGSDDLIYGLGRIWEAHVKQPALKTAVFRTAKEAEQWIAARMKSQQLTDESTSSTSLE
jgi:hypothetical protein